MRMRVEDILCTVFNSSNSVIFLHTWHARRRAEKWSVPCLITAAHMSALPQPDPAIIGKSKHSRGHLRSPAAKVTDVALTSLGAGN